MSECESIKSVNSIDALPTIMRGKSPVKTCSSLASAEGEDAACREEEAKAEEAVEEEEKEEEEDRLGEDGRVNMLLFVEEKCVDLLGVACPVAPIVAATAAVVVVVVVVVVGGGGGKGEGVYEKP